MARLRWNGSLLLVLGALAGCASGPTTSNPMPVQPHLASADAENPLFVPQGPDGYSLVFDRTYDVIDKYFDISRSNRFDGWIETWPTISAGYAEPWRFGCYDKWENLQSTFQTIRRRAEVQINADEVGGYYLEVRVHKELEDLPRPLHASTGAAVLRTEIPIERQYEVVEPTLVTQGWIPIGRDHALEQVILAELRGCL